MSQTIEMLLKRRSVVAINLTGAGPTNEQLTTLLQIAARVPDHGKLAPWRFVVFQGDARAEFGSHLRDITKHNSPDAGEERLDFEATRLMRAPLVIAVISNKDPFHKIPEWEQVLSAGAVCQNLLIAATAMGFGAQWLTEWYSYDKAVRAPLSLSEHENVAGFIYIGSTDFVPDERDRPDMDSITTHWTSPNK